MKAHNFKNERPELTVEDISNVISVNGDSNIINYLDELAEVFYNYKYADDVLTELINWKHYEYSKDLLYHIEELESLIEDELDSRTKVWINLELSKDQLLSVGTRVKAKHGNKTITGTIIENPRYTDNGKYVLKADCSEMVGNPIVKMETVELL